MHRTEEIEVNSQGGKQSKIYARYDLVDPRALHCLAAILHRGAIKYDVDNWRGIPAKDHINHALHHINSWLEEKREPSKPAILHDEDELAHAFCRVMMALAQEIAIHGIHSEHFNPFFHEGSKAPSVESELVREDRPGERSKLQVDSFSEGKWNPSGIGNPAGWDDPKRPSAARSSNATQSRNDPSHY